MKQSRTYTKEILEEAAKDSLSVSDICRKLNKTPRGGIFELIKNRLREYEIDTSHFLGQAAVAGKRNPCYNNRKSKEEILVADYKFRASHTSLKRALLENGREYKCEICNTKDWNDKPITLDIDHIDGNWEDCQEHNLRFLCPNCHRQTDTFGNKNMKGKNKIVSKCECGNIKNKRAKRCKICENKSRKKVK